MNPMHESMRQLMGDATKGLEALQLQVGSRVTGMPDVVDVRRRRLSGNASMDAAGYLTLVEGPDELLDWQVDSGPSRDPIRRAGRRGLFDAKPIDQMAFTPVEGSKVSAFLAKLDGSFNDRYGLYGRQGQRIDQVVPEGRVLLIIHGTFSKCDAIVKQLENIPDGSGQTLLTAAATTYDQVILFEHPTLAVSPMLNALDLARAFDSTKAQVDVICHSRGGLVARWWLEVLSPHLLANARVVFCGSPLMGTGLASPYRLRSALKLLTNYAAALQQAGSLVSLAVPLFSVAQGLMTLVASSTAVLARAPIADAVVAMVPGLGAMSRFGPDGNQTILGNFELEKLSFGRATAPSSYFAVSSNFETADVGWKFWKAFRDVKAHLADAATDALFSGENDLVVDTDSMRRLASEVQISDPTRRLDFGTNPTVHHLNYFSQPSVVASIRQWLVV